MALIEKKKRYIIMSGAVMAVLIFLAGLKMVIGGKYARDPQVLLTGNEAMSTLADKEGSLHIKLLQFGGTIKDRFTVTVMIDDKKYDGNVEIDGKVQKIENGKMRLKGNQNIEIMDISPESSYRIVEDEDISYDTMMNGEESLELTGKLDESSAVKTVMICNSWKSGSINLRNENKGGQAGEVFQFTVIIGGELYNGPARINGKDIQVKDGVIWLKGSETAVITDIPFGTAYEMTERAHREYTTIVDNLETCSATGIISGQNPVREAVFENIWKLEKKGASEADDTEADNHMQEDANFTLDVLKDWMEKVIEEHPLTDVINNLFQRKTVRISVISSQETVYVKLTDGLGRPVEGVRYQLFAKGEAKGKIAECREAYTEDFEDGIYTTGLTGYVILKGLPANDYYLAELVGGEGYEFSGKEYAFTIKTEE